MAKKLSIGQNALFNSAGAVFYLACQWLITVLVVHLASYEDAGVLSLAMSITNMFFTLATFGLRDFQVSDARGQFSTADYVSTRIFTCLCSTVLCAGVILLNGQYTAHEAACIIVYMLFRVTEALVDVFQAIQQKAERMDCTCISFVLRGVFILGVFCAALALTHNLLAAIAGMAFFSLGVVLCFDLTTARRLSPFRLSFSLKRSLSLMKTCAPLMCNSLLTAAIVALPRSLLESLWGSYLLGIYASVATPAVIVQSAAMWIYTPTLTSFTRYYAQGDKKSFYRLYKQIWLIIAGATILVLVAARLLGRWGLQLLFNEEIVDYAYLLIPVLGTTILIACSYFLGAMLTITRHLRIIVLSNAVSMALVLLFARPLVAAFGMDGVNDVIYLAMGANVIILFTALTLALRRRFKQPEPKPK